jgi:hypothetical protein
MPELGEYSGQDLRLSFCHKTGNWPDRRCSQPWIG